MTVYPLLNKDLNALGITQLSVGSTTSPSDKVYLTSVQDSIIRILTTRVGERVMQPEFGSNLHLLRDRNFDADWRIRATRYVYEAIKKWEKRAIFKQLIFKTDPNTGKHSFQIKIDPAT